MMLKQEKQVWNMLCDAFGQEVAKHWMGVCLSIFEQKTTVRGDDGGLIIYREVPMGCGDSRHLVPTGATVAGEIAI